MTNHDRRLDRLASILPDRRKQLGCRREDHETRRRVDDVPEDLENRDEIIARRIELARQDHDEVARQRFEDWGQ